MKKVIFVLFLVGLGVVLRGQPIIDKPSVKSIMDKVNRYQRDHPWQKVDDNWIRGTYYAGVMACYQATGDKKYLDQCDELGVQLKWKVPAAKIDSRGSGVNLLTCGQTFLESYMVKKRKYKITQMMDQLDNPDVLSPTSRPLDWYFEGGRRYVDGLFTGPPALVMLYHVTKDEKYLRWMEACFWDVYGSLYDIEANLFYRDHRFFPECINQRKNNPDWKGNYQVTARGKKVLWSRGNGWAFAGITRILKYLPKDHASYKRYEQVFKNMAQSLKSRQSEEGFWYPNLDDPDYAPVKETSGTGFFIYGLAYGINEGILNKEKYLPVVEKGWKSLYDAVSEEGKVQWGQKVGDQPVMTKMDDSHEYVSGTFLLAASEVYKLKN